MLCVPIIMKKYNNIEKCLAIDTGEDEIVFVSRVMSKAVTLARGTTY